MSDTTIVVNGVPRRVPEGVSLAVALWRLGIHSFRRDSTGRPRAPLCAMGSCHECRVVIDGHADQRSCLVEVREGMKVELPT